MYSDKVMDHFRNPHNYGKMEDADAIGKVGNIVCGDVMWLYLKIDNDVIKDIKFETFGCTAAIATSSMVTDLAVGKTLTEALEITNQKVTDSLDGLPPVKMHCSVLAAEALNEAIYNYLKGHNREVPEIVMTKHDNSAAHMETLEKRYENFIEPNEKHTCEGHTTD
jgi:nitrogen fixation NifU-like protein